MSSTEKKLIKAYKKYIHFLSEAYDEAFLIANAHGYNCSEAEVAFGQQLRNDIQDLENECGVPDEILMDYLY
jgi:hypothetical protein